MTLFPLDTLKTRLQSQHGFFQSGGFKQLYKGVEPVVLGSAPSGIIILSSIIISSRYALLLLINIITAAIFFLTYEGIKQYSQPYIPDQYHFIIHMIAASFSEVVSSN